MRYRPGRLSAAVAALSPLPAGQIGRLGAGRGGVEIARGRPSPPGARRRMIEAGRPPTFDLTDTGRGRRSVGREVTH